MPSGPGKRWSIVFASREVWPFVEGGGIGRSVWATARLLAEHAEVTVVTSERWRAEHERLARNSDERLPRGVRFAFAVEPNGDLSPFVSWHHLWSVRLLGRVVALYPGGGPDVVEVADYQGEGFAFVHAIQGQDPRLRRTRLAVRLATSAEICARLNEEPTDLPRSILWGIERFPLRFAQVLLWPGGNSLDYYGQFYGAGELAAGVRCPLPTATDIMPRAQGPRDGDGPLRLLYLNRLERRKGIEELIAAIRDLPEADLELTVVGRDTDTGPEGSSMLGHARKLAGGDARIAFREQVPHARVPELFAASDLVVVPSRWETFSYVSREALAANRPVLATPSGAVVDIVEAGRSGWLAGSSSPTDLRQALSEVLDARDVLRSMIAEGGPRSVFERVAGDSVQLDAYEEVLERGPAERPRGRRRAEVIVRADGPAHRPSDTLRSLEDQRGVELVDRTLVVNGDSRPLEPAEVARASRFSLIPAHGDTGAWWRALLASLSEDAVAILPSRARLHPTFLARATSVLAADSTIGYVTAFVSHGSSPWHAPLGNYHLPVSEIDAAASIALIRRSLLTKVLADGDPPRSDGELFARLASRGAAGVVLHEALVLALPRRRCPIWTLSPSSAP